jgi:hypothetical protein
MREAQQTARQGIGVYSLKLEKRQKKEFLTTKAANRRFDEPVVRGYIKHRFLFPWCARTEGSFVVSFFFKTLGF